MKTQIKLLIVLVMSITCSGVQAQNLVVDDFNDGMLSTVNVQSGEGAINYQNGRNILGNKRRLQAKVRSNELDHGIQYSVMNDHLGISAGYGARGTLFLSYGKDKSGNAALNSNLSEYQSLNIQLSGPNTSNGLYVALFTGTSRSVYKQTVKEKEGSQKVSIPLEAFKKVGENFSWEDVDSIRIQFDARNTTGCNMAIDKIWFE